jgi:hypothetical protein
MYRKCYAKIENNSQKQVVAIVLFRGYTLRLLILWVSSFGAALRKKEFIINYVKQ